MLTGRCRCGAVRYYATGRPGRLFICHCDACRRQTGSAFDVALEMPRDDIHLRCGMPRRSSRIADSGRRVVSHFCPDCGSLLWQEGDGPGASLAVGTLDDALDLSGAIHLYVGQRLPGVMIPSDALQYPGEPDE